MDNGIYNVEINGKLIERLPEWFDATNGDSVPLKRVFKLIRQTGTISFEAEKWFLLHGTKLERRDPSGNLYHPEVKFVPCYVSPSNKVKKIVLEGIETEPEIEERFRRLRWKIRNNKNISVRCVIECCKVLGKDLWTVLEGEKLRGKTSSKNITIPEKSPKLEELVAWIITEGHIPISHPSIEINQIDSQSEVLDDIAKTFEDIFNVENVANFSSTEAWSGEKGQRLIISSSAIRQFLVLRYNVPLGKKSRKISWNMDINKNNYRNLLSAFIQTEGSINTSLTKVRFEFKIQDKNVRDACYKCLQILGCNPSKSRSSKTYNTGVYSYKGVLRLHKFMKEELPNRELTNKTKKHIENSDILVGLKDQSWSKYIQSARQELDSQAPNKAFVKAHNEMFPKNKINHVMVSSWALSKASPRLSATITALNILDKSPKEELPEYLQSYISSSLVQEICPTSTTRN